MTPCDVILDSTQLTQACAALFVCVRVRVSVCLYVCVFVCLYVHLFFFLCRALLCREQRWADCVYVPVHAQPTCSAVLDAALLCGRAPAPHAGDPKPCASPTPASTTWAQCHSPVTACELTLLCWFAFMPACVHVCVCVCVCMCVCVCATVLARLVLRGRGFCAVASRL